MQLPTALTIAGSDCSGGAGIQADIKTFSAHGVFGMSAITAVVAENTCRVAAIEEISPDMIRRQIEAVLEDLPVGAIKLGMLPSAASMEAVSQALHGREGMPVVADPVMAATNGGDLMQTGALDTFLRRILPLCLLLTPNLPEAETILGKPIRTPEECQQAARAIQAMGVPWVLLKGGHLDGETADDLLFNGETFFSFPQKRIPTQNTHGTGCTLSAAIAANLALGKPIPQAVEEAKAYVTHAIAAGLELGHGHGPIHHFYAWFPSQEPGNICKEEHHGI